MLDIVETGAAAARDAGGASHAWGRVVGRARRRPMFFRQLAAEAQAFVGDEREQRCSALAGGGRARARRRDVGRSMPALRGDARDARCSSRVRDRIAARAKESSTSSRGAQLSSSATRRRETCIDDPSGCQHHTSPRMRTARRVCRERRQALDEARQLHRGKRRARAGRAGAGSRPSARGARRPGASRCADALGQVAARGPSRDAHEQQVHVLHVDAGVDQLGAAEVVERAPGHADLDAEDRAAAVRLGAHRHVAAVGDLAGEGHAARARGASARSGRSAGGTGPPRARSGACPASRSTTSTRSARHALRAAERGRRARPEDARARAARDERHVERVVEVRVPDDDGVGARDVARGWRRRSGRSGASRQRASEARVTYGSMSSVWPACSTAKPAVPSQRTRTPLGAAPRGRGRPGSRRCLRASPRPHHATRTLASAALSDVLHAGRELGERRLGVREAVALSSKRRVRRMSGVSFQAAVRLADERRDLRRVERRVVAQVQRHDARVRLAAERRAAAAAPS